jgi:hypothetical protein
VWLRVPCVVLLTSNCLSAKRVQQRPYRHFAMVVAKAMCIQVYTAQSLLIREHTKAPELVGSVRRRCTDSPAYSRRYCAKGVRTLIVTILTYIYRKAALQIAL